MVNIAPDYFDWIEAAIFFKISLQMKNIVIYFKLMDINRFRVCCNVFVCNLKWSCKYHVDIYLWSMSVQLAFHPYRICCVCFAPIFFLYSSSSFSFLFCVSSMWMGVQCKVNHFGISYFVLMANSTFPSTNHSLNYFINVSHLIFQMKPNALMAHPERKTNWKTKNDGKMHLNERKKNGKFQTNLS